MTQLEVVPGLAPAELDTLEQIQQRVLWLATRIIDSANHDRPGIDGIKVGGHQASSASMVSIMTALWFAHLRPADRVSVKPHASPVLHAINYLLGRLEQDQLTKLRSFGGLQAYPSRSKDPDPVDFSTGSVGLGATAPLFAAATRRYVDAHFGARDHSRFIALLGDAELDEGNIWEALLDPALAGLGNVLWIVDLNRQSLDRVVPGIKVRALERTFADLGWQVLEVKYGRRLEAAFTEPGGEALRHRIDEMPNDEYQAMFGMSPDAIREALCLGDVRIRAAVAAHSDDELRRLIGDLGGHDIGALVNALQAADTDPDRPTVLFAYTLKGWGLPFAGDPMNHSAMLTPDQVDALRTASGLGPESEWARFDPTSAAGRRCVETANLLQRRAPPTMAAVVVPPSALGALPSGRPVSTQEAFGRVLSSLARTETGARVVTLAPDVSVSTHRRPAADAGSKRAHSDPSPRPDAVRGASTWPGVSMAEWLGGSPANG
ncbi:MAG TPA: 1-deoxy-D-xylulose-5-phosphate synthase N-terminal domain-containing protein, partial [Acidimicrobiales bacterium]|nr:1-deoxy-D-xylulose-5-phosphate synthase N-terminal domain-containing protein [Acidimicrobiales bacterium]